MTIAYSVEKDFKQVSKMFRALPGLTETVATTSLNKTITTVKGISTKTIAKKTGLKQKNIRARLVIRKAIRKQLIAEVKANPRKITNLIEFVSAAKSKPGAFRKKPGVTAKVWARKQEYEGTFIGKGKNSGKVLVFKIGRTQSGKRGAVAVRGPSIPKTFLTKEVEKVMENVAGKEWRKHFNEQMRWQLGRRGYL